MRYVSKLEGLVHNEHFANSNLHPPILLSNYFKVRANNQTTAEAFDRGSIEVSFTTPAGGNMNHL